VGPPRIYRGPRRSATPPVVSSEISSPIRESNRFGTRKFRSRTTAIGDSRLAGRTGGTRAGGERSMLRKEGARGEGPPPRTAGPFL